MENSYIGGKYQVMEKLGKGAFGEIYRAINRTNGQELAVKLEDITTKHQQLYAECKVYLWLHCATTPPSNPTESNPDPPSPPVPLPNIYYYGVLPGRKAKNVLIMDMLGPSLMSLLKKPTYRP